MSPTAWLLLLGRELSSSGVPKSHPVSKWLAMISNLLELNGLQKGMCCKFTARNPFVVDF